MKQKNIKKIVLLGFVFVATTIGITYASWQAGGGVKWIADPDNTSRFTGPTNVGGVSAYTDTFTNLKWEANPSGTAQWANCSSPTDCQNYGEPTWNGTNYSYPAGRAETDYPAFKHCIDKGAGWRLPTKKEWVTIMTYTHKNGSYYTALPSVSTNYYWSATEHASYTSIAWRPYFYNGTMGTNYKNYTNSILCIHD